MTSSGSEAFERDYETLRAGHGVVELAGWSSISVTGRDRQTYLNSFCTNDVKRLVPGASCEAFFCNVKGKIVGHGVIGCRSDEIVFVGAPGQAASLVEHLDRYIIREDVKLADTTAVRSYFFSAGEVPATYTSIAWDLIGGSRGAIIEATANYMTAQQSVAVDEKAFSAARIEAGFPLFGVDFDADNLPQEVGRDRQAISFTKGCYLGQETVARIDALGHVNRQLVAVRFEANSLPERGAELSLDGATVGAVTSASWSPTLGAPIALAMVRRGANATGTRLVSAMGECEVVGTPVV
jgi:tRNA-modifying protein YgfZ